jgi:hypothetical protein
MESFWFVNEAANRPNRQALDQTESRGQAQLILAGDAAARAMGRTSRKSFENRNRISAGRMRQFLKI